MGLRPTQDDEERLGRRAVAGIKPLLTKGFGRVGRLFDRRGMARRVKQPNADGYCQRHHNDHPKDHSGDI
jgi:hypothetical protein